MGSLLKKAAGFFKAVLPFVIEHWQAITGVFGGATIVSIIAILGRFINSLSGILRLPVKFNVPLWLVIVISPIALYGIYVYILNKKENYGAGRTMLYCPVCRDNFYDSFTEVEAVRKIIKHKNALSMKPNKKADKHT